MKTNTRWISILLLASVVLMPLAWAGESPAQTRPQSNPTMSEDKHVQGAIKSVDQSGNMVTLDDGTQLVIPDNVTVPRGNLKAGTIVKASFEEKGGQKVVTSLEVQSR